MSRSILVVEDEQNIRDGLLEVLKNEGYKAAGAADGETGFDRALREKFDLILLDIMLPGMDGFEVCRRLREIGSTVPVIMLTALGKEEDIITGFEAGADDYVTKPFSLGELTARIAANLRRTSYGVERPDTLTVGGARVDFTANEVSRRGKKTVMTQRESDLLKYFITHAASTISREDLLRDVWGYNNPGDIETRTIDMHIAKLRSKIEKTPGHPSVIVSIRGEGYRLADGALDGALGGALDGMSKE